MSNWKAWCEWIRLPNFLTAVADIAAGAALLQHNWNPVSSWVSLALASILAYWAGMGFNDLHDFEEDRKLGRRRPLVDGRIDRKTASRVAWSMALSAGFLALLHPTWRDPSRLVSEFPSIALIQVSFPSGLVAASLMASILLYDSRLKRTVLGPGLMGLCRSLNLALGTTLSACEDPETLSSWGKRLLESPHVLWVIVFYGVYVAGFTIAARREAVVSRRGLLATGWGVSLVGWICISLAPWLKDADVPFFLSSFVWFPALLGVIAFPLARRAWWSIQSLQPTAVQAAIRHAILTIILLDASLCLAFAGRWYGAIVCLFLLPTLFLANRFRMT